MTEENLQKFVPSYKPRWPKYLELAQQIYNTYNHELEMIRWYYHPTPWKKKLSEAEVFLQCINMAASARFVRGKGKCDYFQQLRRAYASLAEWVGLEISAAASGRYQMIAACFFVDISLTQSRIGSEGESFAWLLIPDLFETWKRVQENGFIDNEDE